MSDESSQTPDNTDGQKPPHRTPHSARNSGFRQEHGVEQLLDLWFRLTKEEKRKCFSNAKDVADLLDLDPKRIYGLHDEGRIPSIKIGGRVHVYLPGLKDLILQNDGWGPIRRRPKRTPEKGDNPDQRQ